MIKAGTHLNTPQGAGVVVGQRDDEHATIRLNDGGTRIQVAVADLTVPADAILPFTVKENETQKAEAHQAMLEAYYEDMSVEAHR